MAERGRLIVVVLRLPAGTITMRAEVAHCSAPDTSRGENSYLFGVSIVEIEAEAHGLLIEYIGG